MAFIGNIRSRTFGKYVLEILAGPFIDRKTNKWTIIATISYNSLDCGLIKETKILEFDTKEEAKAIKVGSKVGERTYLEWA